MNLLRWYEGPKKMGCVYHKRGVCRLGNGRLVVDVFVMPSIVKRRPIAITIGLYAEGGRATLKRQCRLKGTDQINGSSLALADEFLLLGISDDRQVYLAEEVENFLARENVTLKRVLKSVGAA